jgi:hypothetical protein
MFEQGPAWVYPMWVHPGKFRSRLPSNSKPIRVLRVSHPRTRVGLVLLAHKILAASADSQWPAAPLCVDNQGRRRPQLRLGGEELGYR